MNPTRRLKLQSVIAKELAQNVTRILKDPRLVAFTITSVTLSADGSQALVNLTLLGGSIASEEQSAKNAVILNDLLKALDEGKGLLKKFLGKALKIRQIPNLVFKQDKGFENVFRVGEILKSIKNEEPALNKDSQTNENLGESDQSKLPEKESFH